MVYNKEQFLTCTSFRWIIERIFDGKPSGHLDELLHIGLKTIISSYITILVNNPIRTLNFQDQS